MKKYTCIGNVTGNYIIHDMNELYLKILFGVFINLIISQNFPLLMTQVMGRSWQFLAENLTTFIAAMPYRIVYRNSLFMLKQ